MKLNKGLLGGSLILLITINLFFVLNYFFHFAMARMLTIADYGVVVTLYSIIYMLGIFTESIQTVISKYTTKETNPGKLKNLVKRSLNKTFKVSLGVFVVYLLISIALTRILSIEYSLLALTGLMLFASFTLPVTRGFLQGKKKFTALGLNMISEALSKFALAVFLVLIGWKIYGAMIATLLGVFISLGASLLTIRKTFNVKEEKAETPGIYGYTLPVFIVITTIIVFFSIDVIIARAMFSPEVSGYYAVASMVAKVIFFGTQPISKAMFPLSSESNKDKSSNNIFLNAFSILLVLIAIALLLVGFVPDLLVRIFSGSYIQESISILLYTSLAMSLISIANLVLLYKLSKGKTRNSSFLPIFLVIQISLMTYFSSTLEEFSLALLASSAILVAGSSFLLKEPKRS